MIDFFIRMLGEHKRNSRALTPLRMAIGGFFWFMLIYYGLSLNSLLRGIIISGSPLAAYIVWLAFVAWGAYPQTPRASRLTVAFPCPPPEIDNYYKLLRKVFWQHEIPTLSALRSAVEVNKYALIVCKNPEDQGRVLGGIELYGLEQGFFDEYLSGKRGDKHFGDATFADLQEILRQQRLYCSIITDIGLDYFNRGVVVSQLIETAIHVCESVYFKDQNSDYEITLYAAVARQEGKALATTLGFWRYLPRKTKLFAPELLQLKLSRQGLEEVRNRLPYKKDILTVLDRK